jgi:hypothetical protein
MALSITIENHMNIRNNFQDNNIIELSREDYMKFLKRRTLSCKKVWPYSSFRVSSSQKARQHEFIEWPVLVHSSDSLENFFQSHTPEHLAEFLQNSTLAYYLPEKQILRLPGHVNLEQALLDSFSHMPELPMLDFDNKENLKGHLSSKPILHALWQASHQQEFKGMMTCCECGVACCTSEHVWIKNGTCLFYLSVVAAGISEIRLLPFGVKQQLVPTG